MDINCVYYCKGGRACSLSRCVCNRVLHTACLHERPCPVKKGRKKEKEEAK
jgi:hypothetical protein